MNEYQKKRDKWGKYFTISLIVTIVSYTIGLCSTESLGVCIFFLILGILGIIMCVVCTVKINIYNAKARGLSASQYLDDRFANAIPETKEVFGINDVNVEIKCPMCQSTNTTRITTVDRAISIGAVGLASGKIGKQYQCKNCKHMW